MTAGAFQTIGLVLMVIGTILVIAGFTNPALVMLIFGGIAVWVIAFIPLTIAKNLKGNR